MLKATSFKVTIINVFILFALVLSNSLNAQTPPPSCTFSTSPTAPLTNCLSTVVATLNLPNPNNYGFVEVFYPVQFDLTEIGSNTGINEIAYQVDGNIYTTIQVTNTSVLPSTTTSVILKRVQIPNPTSTDPSLPSIPLTFNVNTCEDNFTIANANLFDTDQFPMYFDIQAFAIGSNSPISFQFSQQVQVSGSSGIIRFSSLNASNAQLVSAATNNPFYVNQNTTLTRNCSLILSSTSQPLPSQIQFTVTSEQDVIPTRYFLLNSSGTGQVIIPFTSSSNGNQTVNTVTISSSLLQSAGFSQQIPPSGITLIQEYKQSCPQSYTFLSTNVIASITCPGLTTCSPTNTNSITWNSVVPTDRPYQITDHNLSAVSGTCSDYLYDITFHFPATSGDVLVNQISFPFAFPSNNVAITSVTDQNGNVLGFNISSNRLIIGLNASNVPAGFTFDSGLNGVVPNLTAFDLNLRVTFSLILDNNQCPTNLFSGLSDLNPQLNFAQIRFQSTCLDNSNNSINQPISSRFNLPNQSYTISSVCPDPDLTPDEQPFVLAFNYTFYSTGTSNPLAFYENTSVNPIGCAQYEYQFVLSNLMSTNDGSHLFSLSNTSTLNYTHLNSNHDGAALEMIINGVSYPCLISNNSIIASVPASVITTATSISAHFELDGCPFANYSPFSGAMTFWLQVKAVCISSGCTNVSRVLACSGSASNPSCIIAVQCIGQCTPAPGYQGAQTADGFNVKRVTYGWENSASTQPIQSEAAFLGLFPSSELQKVYPYDVIKIEAPGSFAYSNLVDEFAFELAMTPLLGEINGSSNQSLLEIVPGSAILTILSNGNTYVFNDNFTFSPNSQIIFGPSPTVPPDPNPVQIAIPAEKLQFELNQPNLFFTDVQSFSTQTVDIRFSALFRIKPQRKLITDPTQAVNTSQDFFIQGQFLTSFINDDDFESSCEQYREQLILLTPGLTIHSGTEEYANEILDLVIDDINPTASTFNFTTVNEHGHCKANFGYGVYSYGGYGPSSEDFAEFRPLFGWPASGSIQNNSNLNFDYYNLYNDGSLGSSQTNSLMTAFPLPYEKGEVGNLGVYSGLAVSVNKNSPTSLSCGETNGSDDFTINIPIQPFAYVTNSPINYPPSSTASVFPYQTIELADIQTPIPSNPIIVQNLDNYLNNQLFSVGGLNMLNLCQRLSNSTNLGNQNSPSVQVSDHFSYSFNFGSLYNSTIPNFPLPAQRVWALASLFDSNNNPINGVALGLFTTPTGSSTYPGPNGELLIYFENEPQATQTLNLININYPTCLPNGAYLKITFGMFCRDVVEIQTELNDFFLDPESFSCSSCEKIVPLMQQYGLTYSTNSSISFNNYPSCNLQWDVVLENPVNNLTLNKNQIRFVLPDGLLPPMLANGNIVYSYTNGQGQQVTETPNFDVSFGGASVSGGPVADVSTVMDIQFDPAFSWQQGAQISFTLNFVFSSELCEVISPKIGTELQLIVFSVPACYSPTNLLNIPIETNSEFPVLLSQAGDLASMLQPDQSGNTCCKDYQVDLFVQDECPGQSNGYLFLSDVFEIIGDNNISYISSCSLTLYNNSNQQIFSNLSINGPYTIPNLVSGTYMLAINVDNGINPPFTLFEGFVVNANQEQCATCLCADGSAPVIVNQNITTGLIFQNFIETFQGMNVCFNVKNDIGFFANQGSITLQDEEFIMAPGVELKMHQGSVINILGCTFSGCEKLWKGINSEAKLLKIGRSANNFTTIKDALYGVYLVRYLATVGSSYPHTWCDEVLFCNNFIGISSSEEIGSHNLLITKRTEFRGGNLLPAYEGQEIETFNRSFAGIRVLNGFVLNLNEKTLFNKLKFGVLAYRSNVHIEKSEFQNISDFDPLYNSNFSNYYMPSGTGVPTTAAICVHGNSKLYVLGYGWEENVPIMFNSCRIGVLSHSSRVQVHKSKFDWTLQTPCERAIMLFDCKSNNQARIESNSIRAKIVGIEATIPMTSVNNITQVALLNNYIRIASQNTVPSGGGVEVLKTGIKIDCAFNGKVAILNNTVEIESQHNAFYTNGIQLNGLSSPSSEIVRNVVNRNTHSKGNGFLMTNSSHIKFYENSSWGLDIGVGNNANTGFTFASNYNQHISRNCSNNLKTGFLFKQENPSTFINDNKIGNHHYTNGYGLKINQGATIGPQIDAQNQWDDSYSGFKARNDGDPSNLFRVYTSTGAPDPVYYPEHTPNDNCLIDPFIRCVSGTSANTTACLAQGSTVNWIGTENSGDGEDVREKILENTQSIVQRLLNGQITFEEYIEESNYALQKSLDAFLNDSLISIPDTGVFYILRNSLQSTNLSKLNEIEKVAKGEYIDSSIISSLRIQQIELDSILQHVNLLDSLFTSNGDTIGSILDVERQELFEIQHAKQNQINALTQTLQTASQIQRDSITSMNDRIVSNKHYELYDQELNTIEIKRLNAEVMYYLPEQEQVIESIASLCPVAGGPAVYKARAMLTLFNDTLVFYDDSLCAEQGYAYRLAQQHSDSTETIEECIVYPNPSRSVFMVYTGTKDIDEIKELTLYNSLGQIVLRKRDSGNQFVLDFMANSLAEGIYTLQISFPFNGRIEYKKLVYAK